MPAQASYDLTAPRIYLETGDVRVLRLTRGFHTVISAAQFEVVGGFKWSAQVCGDGRVYAARWAERNSLGSRRKFYLHRMITGAPFGMKVDHWNGDTLDNRDCNLRITTTDQNNANRVYSGVVGVILDPRSCLTKRYRARLGSRHLGYFLTEAEAAAAYDAAALETFGPYAVTNASGRNGAPDFPIVQQEEVPF